MTSGPTYQYPLLPVSEILVSFRESNINVTDNDLKNPDPRRWHTIYAQLFQALTNKPIEQVIQSLFRVERMQTDYHDLFEEGFAQMAFTSCLQRVLCSCGYESFSVKDVIQPTSKSVQRISSVFLNALRHNQIRKAFAQDTLERVQKSRGQFESVLDKNRKLKDFLAKGRETQSLRDAEFQKAQEEFEHEQHCCVELNKQQEEERRSVEELKFRLAELDTEKENVKHVIASVQQEVEKMSVKIVQSPKRFRQELERHKKKVLDLKEELSKKEQTLSENRLLLEQTINNQMAIGKAIKLCKEVQGDLEKEYDIDAEIQRLTDALQDHKENYNMCYSHEEDLREKLRVRQEQLYKITGQIDRREQSTHQHLMDLKQHQEKLKEKVLNLGAETSQIVSRATCLKDEMSDVVTELEDKKKEIKRELFEAVEEVSACNDFVMQSWSGFRSAILSDDE